MPQIPKLKKAARLFALVLATSALLAGCQSGSVSPAANPSSQQLNVDGSMRTWLEYVPSGPAQPQALPLVIVLHGTGSSGAAMVKLGDFEHWADRAKFLLAAPDSLGRAFNEGSGRIGPGFETVDDVAFITAMIDDIRQRHNVSDVFAVGFSSGAAMVQRLALESPVSFNGMVAVSGHLWHELPRAPISAPVPMLLMFGDQDPLNPVGGGPVRYREDLVLDKPSHGTTARRWASMMGCSISVSARAHVIETRRWPNCRDNSSLRITTISELGHFWPGGTLERYEHIPPERVGPYSSLINATEYAVAFFAEISSP